MRKKMNEELLTLQRKLERACKRKNQKQITKLRSIYLKKLKQEIKKTNQEELKNLWLSEMKKHKKQLASRYKKEFLEEKATFSSLLTVLPKSIQLAIQRFFVHLSLTVQEKKQLFSLIKTTMLLPLTPIVYTGKFLLRHWYLLLLLLSLGKLPNFEKENQKNQENTKLEKEYEPSVQKESSLYPMRAPSIYHELTNSPLPREGYFHLHLQNSNMFETLENIQLKTPVPSIQTVASSHNLENELKLQNLYDQTKTSTLKQSSMFQNLYSELPKGDFYQNIRLSMNAKMLLQECLESLISHGYFVLLDQVSNDTMVFENQADFKNYLRRISIPEEKIEKTLEELVQEPNYNNRKILFKNDPYVFENEQELLLYLLSLEDKNLTNYLLNFAKKHEEELYQIASELSIILPTSSDPSIATYLESATAVYILWQIIKISAAPYTAGYTLVLP